MTVNQARFPFDAFYSFAVGILFVMGHLALLPIASWLLMIKLPTAELPGRAIGVALGCAAYIWICNRFGHPTGKRQLMIWSLMSVFALSASITLGVVMRICHLL